MDTRALGSTNIEVTPVGMGVLTVGRTQLALGVAEGASVVRHALLRGINFLDTAEYYETYPYIAEAFRRMRAEGGEAAALAGAAVVSSKSLAQGRRGMERAIEDCRAALGRDTIDIFLLHEVRGGHDIECRAGAREALADAKARGRVRAIGLSTHHVDVTLRAAGMADMDVVFALANFKGMGIRDGDAPGTKEGMAAAMAACAENGKGVFVMKAFGGGNLCGSYTEALGYAASLPGVARLTFTFTISVNN